MGTKIKYDVTETEEFEGYAGPTPKRGIYECKVRSAEFRESANGYPMWEIIVILDGKTKEAKPYNGCPLWQYVTIGDLSEEWMKRNLKGFMKAIGKPEKGTIDGEAIAKQIVDKRFRVIVKNENSEEYGLQAKANGLLPLKATEEAEAGAEEDVDEDAESEEETEEEETEEDGDEEEETTVEEDIADLTRAELKTYIKENELEVKVTKSMSDDDIRNAIIEAWPEDEDEEDGEEDDEEQEGDEPPF